MGLHDSPHKQIMNLLQFQSSHGDVPKGPSWGWMLLTIEGTIYPHSPSAGSETMTGHTHTLGMFSIQC